MSAPRMSPAEALQLLRDGNAAFLSDTPLRPPLDRDSRLRLAAGQQPFAAYLSCSDSRVPPELLFGRGLGELFIVRNAGNTLDTAALGSLEFAVSRLGVSLVVVMGHEGCGAVSAALQVVRENARFPGAIGKMIEPIIPAVLEATRHGGGLDDAVRGNVRRVVRELREDASPTLLDPQRAGTVQVVGAHYALRTGVVSFFDLPEPIVSRDRNP